MLKKAKQASKALEAVAKKRDAYYTRMPKPLLSAESSAAESGEHDLPPPKSTSALDLSLATSVGKITSSSSASLDGAAQPSVPTKTMSNPGVRWTTLFETMKAGRLSPTNTSGETSETTSLLPPPSSPPPPPPPPTDEIPNRGSAASGASISTSPPCSPGTGMYGSGSSSLLTSLRSLSTPRHSYKSGRKTEHERLDSLLNKAQSEFDTRAIEFAAELRTQCRTVEEFYVKKVHEYTERLEVLEEAVDMSRRNKALDRDKLVLDSGGDADSADHRRRKTRYSMAEIVQAMRQGSGGGEDGTLSPIDEKLKQLTPRSRSRSGRSPSAANASLDDGGSDDEVDEDEMTAVDEHYFEKLLESDSVKRAVVDLHRNIKLLGNFSIMNYTGFIKIVKKHDKSLPTYKGTLKDIWTGTRFHNGQEAEALSLKLERHYANWFCDGNMLHARAQMLPKVGDGLLMDWSQLRFGYRLGMCAILCLWVCWDSVWQVYIHENHTIGGTAAFPVFRATGGLLVLHWCWGLSTFVWNRFRINYIFLFEFDPRSVNSSFAILNEAVDETLVFLVSMLLYYKACIGAIPMYLPSGAYPAFLVFYTLRCLFFPWRMRKGLWASVGNVLCSPYYPATFFSTYVADVFTSLIKVLQDWAWTFCYLMSGDFLITEHKFFKHPSRRWQSSVAYVNVIIPLICLLPIWFRLMQCLRRYADTGKRWPNLANAAKYSLSQTVTLFGTFHPLYMYNNAQRRFADDDDIHEEPLPRNLFQFFWVGLFIASSLYSFSWDVWMDWGLGRCSHKFLGPRLMFPNVAWYYTAIVADIFLRFLWVTSLVPPDSGAQFAVPNYLTAIVMCAEIGRRTIWGFFRLEQEHRHNTEGYRRVDFVPLHFNTGHDHKYKLSSTTRGTGVLLEVLTVGCAVVAISFASIIAAQKQKEASVN